MNPASENTTEEENPPTPTMEKIKGRLVWLRRILVSDNAIGYARNEPRLMRVILLLALLGFLVSMLAPGLVVFFGLIGSGAFLYLVINEDYPLAVVDIWVVFFSTTPLVLILVGYLLTAYVVENREKKHKTPQPSEVGG